MDEGEGESVWVSGSLQSILQLRLFSVLSHGTRDVVVTMNCLCQSVVSQKALP